MTWRAVVFNTMDGRGIPRIAGVPHTDNFVISLK